MCNHTHIPILGSVPYLRRRKSSWSGIPHSNVAELSPSVFATNDITSHYRCVLHLKVLVDVVYTFNILPRLLVAQITFLGTNHSYQNEMNLPFPFSKTLIFLELLHVRGNDKSTQIFFSWCTFIPYFLLFSPLGMISPSLFLYQAFSHCDLCCPPLCEQSTFYILKWYLIQWTY